MVKEVMWKTPPKGRYRKGVLDAVPVDKNLLLEKMWVN